MRRLREEIFGGDGREWSMRARVERAVRRDW